MLKTEVFPYYRQCVKDFEAVYWYLLSQMGTDYVNDLSVIRGYPNGEQRQLLKELKIGVCDNVDVSRLGSKASEYGMLNKSGKFLLEGRYIIPVHDLEGGIITFIGYYPDNRKYITIPSPFFSKELLLFNFKQAYELSWSKFNGIVFIVEGIFDCLSLRAIGLPCVACMGAKVSDMQCELLKLFRKVIAIPDDDKAGRRALNRYSKYGWKVPYNATMIKFSGGIHNLGGTELHCKDMDDFVAWFEPEDVREILLSFSDSKEDVEELIL